MDFALAESQVDALENFLAFDRNMQIGNNQSIGVLVGLRLSIHKTASGSFQQ